MALMFIDGFDHYTSDAMLETKWTSNGGLDGLTVGAYGRNGGGAVRMSDNSYWLGKGITDSSTVYCGFAVKLANLTTTGTFVYFMEAATNHCDIRVEATTGRVYATRNGTAIGWSAGQVAYANTWLHLQIKVVVHDTAGIIEVLANGVKVLDLSGVDTRNGATGIINSIRLQGVCNSSNTDYDDFYHNTSEHMGDCRVCTILPSGAGATTNFTASAGNNYECVDDATPDGDTSYVYSNTVDHVDTYAFGNLTVSNGIIKGVQVNLVARKDDAGTRTVSPVVRPASTDRVGTAQGLSDDWANLYQMYENNPEDSAAWEIADVNGCEFGIKVAS